jgi:tetratricopeptide (TPR) repeat protein
METQEFFEKKLEEGKKAFASGDFETAVAIFSSLDLQAFPIEEQPSLFLLYALSLYETGNRMQALKKIKEALSINPHYAPAFDAWGNFLLEEGKFYAAISRYRLATKADPGFWLPYFHWGYLLKKMGNTKAALRKFKAALTRNPQEEVLYFFAGDCAFELNFLEEALQFYRGVLKKTKASSEAFARIGNVYFLMGKIEKAKKAYQKSISLNPQEASAYENLGLLLEKQGKWEEATAKYEAGLAQVPDFPSLLFRQGQLFYQMGKGQEAIFFLEKAFLAFQEKVENDWEIEWASFLAECANTLGMAYKAMGETEKAKACFKATLRHAYNHENALQELARMRGIYREHHHVWEFVIEGEVEGNAETLKGLRAYRVAALNADEGFQYAVECEEEIRGVLKLKDVAKSNQIACYAGVLTRGPLMLLRYRDKDGIG